MDTRVGLNCLFMK